MNVSDEEFDQIISQAMDELPEWYIKNLRNVAITYEDEPTKIQRKNLKLRCNQTLFGLFEGIGTKGKASVDSALAVQAAYLPDKITIFKLPILRATSNIEEFKKQVKHTLWHEIAHYYGLDHDRIHAIERGEV